MRAAFIVYCCLFDVAVSSYLKLDISRSGGNISLSDHIPNVESVRSVVFEIKSCNMSRIQLIPNDTTTPVFRFTVEKKTELRGRHRKCHLVSDGPDECLDSVKLDLESCCHRFKTYWTTITMPGKNTIGKGSVTGSDLLSVMQNEGPFYLRDIILDSFGMSEWRIWYELDNSTAKDESVATSAASELEDTSVTASSTVSRNTSRASTASSTDLEETSTTVTTVSRMSPSTGPAFPNSTVPESGAAFEGLSITLITITVMCSCTYRMPHLT